jgi:ribosomal-protein-alanine N-acetyltransferase
MTFAIRNACAGDLAAIVAIERASFSDPWSRGMFATHLGLRGDDVFLAAELDGELLGYAVSRTVGDEAELLNIAVAPSHRGRGVGRRLLDSIIGAARATGAQQMWLEVRASNDGARKLYESRGFVAISVRKGYYHAPREDAVVLRADLLSAPRIDSVTVPELGFTAGPDDTIPSSASHIPRQETK